MQIQLTHPKASSLAALFFLLCGHVPAQTVSFQARREFVVGRNPSAVVVADLNNDTKPDLVTTNASTDNLSVLLGNGDGTFRPALNRGVANAPRALALGDLNGDRKLDVAVAYDNSLALTLLFGNGAGTCASTPISLTLLSRPTNLPGALSLADFNADDRLDLAVAYGSAGRSAVLLGNGDGTFQTATPLTLSGGETLRLAVSDFNRDGALDLAAVSSGRTAGTILLGNGRGGFSASGGFTLEFALSVFAVTDLVAGDFNRDGYPDLALANGANLAGDNLQSLSLWVGRGDGSFPPAALFGVDGNVYTLAAGDFDKDGRLDLAAPFAGETSASNAVAELLNLTIATTRSLAVISAASFTGQALAGDSISAAFGTDLATRMEVATTLPLPTSLAGASVRVRDKRPAPLFFVSPSQLNLLIPSGTALGTATITVTSGNGSVAAGLAPIAAVAPGRFAANANGQGVAAAVVLRVRANGTQSYESV